MLGADFPTDIALFSLKLDPVFRLLPANSETQTAMRTICEALAAAACRLLQIEGSEIFAEYRPAMNEKGAQGTLAEVFLYDTLAGGAGFSPQMAPRASSTTAACVGASSSAVGERLTAWVLAPVVRS